MISFFFVLINSWDIIYFNSTYSGYYGINNQISFNFLPNNFNENYTVEIWTKYWLISISNEFLFLSNSYDINNMSYIKLYGNSKNLSDCLKNILYYTNNLLNDIITCKIIDLNNNTKNLSITFNPIQYIEPEIPSWKKNLVYIAVIFCYCCSAMFSGVNLALLSIDSNTITFLETSEDLLDQKMGKAFRSIHSDENWLICTILLGNVLVNSASSILLSEEGSALVAVIISTFTISIFCEIMPQSILFRYRIPGSYYTLFFTKTAKFILSPIAWPLSKIIGYIISQEGFQTMSQNEIIGFLELTSKLDSEHRIVYGALSLSKYRIKDHYSKNPFVLSPNEILNGNTISKIISSGYSRIPVLDWKGIPQWVLSCKLLSLIPLEKQFNIIDIAPLINETFIEIDANTEMIKALGRFRSVEASFGFVKGIPDSNNELDAIPTICGIVTVEDIIEKVVGEEIFDETDSKLTEDETNQIFQYLSNNDISLLSLAFKVNKDSKLSPGMKILTGEVKVILDNDQGIFAIVKAPFEVPNFFETIVISRSAYVVQI